LKTESETKTKTHQFLLENNFFFSYNRFEVIRGCARLFGSTRLLGVFEITSEIVRRIVLTDRLKAGGRREVRRTATKEVSEARAKAWGERSEL
jgi:hypothetical protein